ncbi:TetR/AcrR family transcriptional regulator [Insolitispirillum peregrinum]|nr:TetR/AcrR family transcriptional regulator [Insolitispirillum peregrinum]
MMDPVETSACPAPRRSKKREAILASARTLFCQEGFVSTSMDAIAAHAQVSKATVYAHFSSKQHLFCEVVSHVTDAYIKLSEDLLDAPLREGLTTIALRFLEMVTKPESVTIYRTLINQGQDFPEMVEAFRDAGPRRIIPAIAHYFRVQSERGRLKIADPLLMATIFLHTVKGEGQGRALGTCISNYPDRVIIDELVTMILTTYAPDRPQADPARQAIST